MYGLTDDEHARRQRLARNTARLEFLIPAFRAVGLPEFNIRGENDYIHTPHGRVIFGVKFSHHENVADGRVFICRLPDKGNETIFLNEWIKMLSEAKAHGNNEHHDEFLVRLAAKFGYVAFDIRQTLFEEDWAARFARRVAEHVDLYVRSMPAATS